MNWNMIDWAYGFGGGVVIGLAAALFLLLNGRIAGISGILGGLLDRAPTDVGERVVFLAGLIGAPALYLLWGHAPAVNTSDSVPLLLIGGLIVGFGARLGSGCASGHGVCGISRLSLRSISAAAVFMAVGVAVVTVIRHLVGGF